jgi:putative membrane protein
MKRNSFVTVAALLAALGIGPVGVAGAQSAPSSATFVRHAAQGGLAEVALGRLAERRAQNSSVNDFAQRMVTDHSRANRELMRIASRRGYTVPQRTDADQRAMRMRLSRMSGDRFDRAYARAMVRDHDTDVAMFRQYARYGRDPALRSWASRTLQTLRDHQRHARRMAREVGVDA